ncbi:MAG: hypothetical protein ACXVB9_08995 [Bdellovibrionota bacterium]
MKSLFILSLLFFSYNASAGVSFGETGVRCTPDNEDNQTIELSTIGLNGERYPGKGSGAFKLDNRVKTPNSYIYEWQSEELEVIGKTGVGELRFNGYDHHLIATYHCVDFQFK